MTQEEKNEIEEFGKVWDVDLSEIDWDSLESEIELSDEEKEINKYYTEYKTKLKNRLREYGLRDERFFEKYLSLISFKANGFHIGMADKEKRNRLGAITKENIDLCIKALDELLPEK